MNPPPLSIFLSISPFNQCHSKIRHNNHYLASLIFAASASSPWLRPTLHRLHAISLPATTSTAPLLLSRMNYSCFKIISSAGVLDPIHSVTFPLQLSNPSLFPKNHSFIFSVIAIIIGLSPILKNKSLNFSYSLASTSGINGYQSPLPVIYSNNMTRISHNLLLSSPYLLVKDIHLQDRKWEPVISLLNPHTRRDLGTVIN